MCILYITPNTPEQIKIKMATKTFTCYNDFLGKNQEFTLTLKTYGGKPLDDERGSFFEGYYYDYCVQKFNRKTITCLYTEHGEANWRKGRKCTEKFVADVEFLAEGNDELHYEIKRPESKNLKYFYTTLTDCYEDLPKNCSSNYDLAVQECECENINPRWIRQVKYWWK